MDAIRTHEHQTQKWHSKLKMHGLTPCAPQLALIALGQIGLIDFM